MKCVDSEAETYHVEALVCVLLCGLSAYSIDSGSLPCICGGLPDTLNGGVQIIVKGAKHRTANVVSKIPWTDKEDVNARHLCNFLHLDFDG